MAQADTTESLVVEARGLTKIFRDFWGRPKARAVNGVNLSVRRGEVFGLLGPNGSGKSTTVKMLLGLLYPTRGKLRVLGELPRKVDTKRRIGYLPEDSYLYHYLTATESLDFFGALFGLAPSERRKRSEQLLEMVGLASAKDRPVGEFSKGMARRIGLAQALINDPELVILDEPTAGLDPIGCREVKDIIRLLSRRGKTVILCSHLLADVEDVCDQVVVLYGGKICAEGALRDMLQIQDKTLIEAPRLDKPVLDATIRTLRETVAEDAIKVDTPSMNLEEFFLDVVRRAREASMETAGAQSGGNIADYLRQGVTEPRGTDLLAALAAHEADATEQPEGTVGSAREDDVKHAETEQTAPEVARAKLRELAATQHDESQDETAPEPPPTPGPRDDEETVRKASERLKQMLDNAPQTNDRADGKRTPDST